MKNIGMAFLGLLLFCALIFGANEAEIFGIKFWGVRKADAQRQVFEQSQSYVEGKRQELIKNHHEWMMAKDSVDKLIIESTIRHNFANFDDSKIVDYDLRVFLTKIKNK